MAFTGEILMRAGEYGGNAMGSRRGGRGQDMVWQGAGKDSFSSGNQVQHNYSHICLSPKSTSDGHSKRRFTTSWWKGLFFWTRHLGVVCLLLFVFSPFALILAIMQMILCDVRPSPRLIKLQQIKFLFGSNYQRNCFQIQVSCAI